MDPISIVETCSLILGAGIAITRWQDFKESLHSITPYFLVGVVLLFAIAAADARTGVVLRDNARNMIVNLLVLFQMVCLGSVGLACFKPSAAIAPLQSWEDGFAFLNRLHRNIFAGVVVGYCGYTILLFYLLAPETFINDVGGVPEHLSLYLASIFAAMGEELYFRLWLIGLVTWIFRKTDYGWLFGIVISTTIWSFAHWYIEGLGWIKFLHILPFGVILGLSLKRYGFEICVFLHVISNVVNMLVLSMLSR
jgi:hypothetical protein